MLDENEKCAKEMLAHGESVFLKARSWIKISVIFTSDSHSWFQLGCVN